MKSFHPWGRKDFYAVSVWAAAEQNVYLSCMLKTGNKVSNSQRPSFE